MPRAGECEGALRPHARSTASVDDPVDKHWACTPNPALARPATRCLRIHQRGAGTGEPGPSAANRPCSLPCLWRLPRTGGRTSPQPPWMTLWKRPVHAAQSQCRRGLQRGACGLTNDRAGAQTGPQTPQPAWMTLWITPAQTRQIQHWRGLQRSACDFISRAPQPPPLACRKARRKRSLRALPHHPQPSWMTLWKTLMNAPQSQHWRGLRRGACSFISPLPRAAA
jgi:hypothetical protein